MKTTISITLLSLACVFSFTTCKIIKGCTDPSSLNYNKEATKDDGSCQYNGQAVFWACPVYCLSSPYSCNTNCASPTISIEGVTIGTITQWYNTKPTCTAAGCVIFTGAPGTYNCTVNCKDDTCSTISAVGTIIIKSNECNPVQIN